MKRWTDHKDKQNG
ncbi:rCG49300, partial [Rattus norvegicus]